MRLLITSGAWALVFALVLLLATGCSIFDTREAEPPGGDTTPWISPSVPSLVFANMISGLEDLTGVNYEKSTAEVPEEPLFFVPMAADLDRPDIDPEDFADWTRDVELQVTQRILASASKVEVEFISPEQTVDQDPYATFEGPYELTITYQSGEVVTYKGKARFDFKRLSQGWHLIKWEDLEGLEGFATWGYLRGITR